MTTEEITLVIQTLQDQLKEKQDIESELRHEIDLQLKQQKDLSNDNDYLRQKLAAIQLDNSNHNNIRARLETQLYAQEQDMMTLKKEIQQLSKWKKDAEKKLNTETESYEHEKSLWQQKEADLYNQIRNLSIQNNNLNGEPRTPRTPRRRSSINLTSNGLSPFYSNGLGDIDENSTVESSHSNNGSSDAVRNGVEHEYINNRPTPKLAPIDSSYLRESKIAQRTIKAQDKLILELKTEIEKQKALLQEAQKETQLQSLKVVHLEHEIASIKQLNRSLMEDNESYQILLHEKTMNGEFMMNPIMQVDNDISLKVSSNNNNLAMKESASTSSSNSGGGGLNLAAELASSIPDWPSKNDTESDKTIQELNDEIKTLQDTNRALQLYMNKILMKIINNKQLVDVLSIDQPSSKPSKEAVNEATATNATEPTSKSGPMPTKTVSTAAHAGTMSKASSHSKNGTNTTNRHRRRTISYWGSKAPSPPPLFAGENANLQEQLQKQQPSAPAPKPERSISTATHSNSSSGGSGWAKALRRMSGLAWSSSSSNFKEESPVPTTSAAMGTNSPASGINNDSAVDSFGEDDTEKSIEKGRKQSGSSTPSISSFRPSNDLGTLDEED
ncbi:hypothetical protein BDF20DRAFT_838968 [Mycotypha africana]|uniref:uncharacterized protein n=1 Tax=Mycotypha africana TaxID=64632 RepID=UPI0023018EB8|nr:uncharacterized protein BDF20DRAFT_838968 [Mycotypha africana]KAI8968993.1 hypothetical protein BDF20DRAFT_838968 [Mycotypha africana]